MAEVADVEALRPLHEAVARGRLRDVEGEVSAALEEVDRRGHFRQEGAARAHGGEGADRAEVAARERVVLDREHRRVEPVLRDRVQELEDRARLGQVLWDERAVEIGPGLDDFDSLPGDALDQRAQNGAAAE